MPDDLAKSFEPKPGKVLDFERMLCEARFSPCGKYLIGAGYDDLVPRWEVTETDYIAMPSLIAHNGWVQGFGFHPKGEFLYTGDSWGKLNCGRYTEEKASPVWTQEKALAGWIRCLAVSPDGETLAIGGNDVKVKLLATKDGALLKELPHVDTVFSVCFHPDSKTLVTGDLKGKVRHFDAASGKLEREFDAGALYKLDKIQECGGARHLAFDAAGERLVVAGHKNPGGGFCTGLPCVLVFDWKTGQQQQEMQVGAQDDGFIYDARFHAAGFVMATSCAFPGKGHFWFWQPGEPKAFYTGKIANGRSLSLHPDNKRLAYTVCVAANGNGRNLQGGEYKGGSAKIHILQFAGG